jgi:hypothetical protein
VHSTGPLLAGRRISAAGLFDANDEEEDAGRASNPSSVSVRLAASLADPGRGRTGRLGVGDGRPAGGDAAPTLPLPLRLAPVPSPKLASRPSCGLYGADPADPVTVALVGVPVAAGLCGLDTAEAGRARPAEPAAGAGGAEAGRARPDPADASCADDLPAVVLTAAPVLPARPVLPLAAEADTGRLLYTLAAASALAAAVGGSSAAWSGCWCCCCCFRRADPVGRDADTARVPVVLRGGPSDRSNTKAKAKPKTNGQIVSDRSTYIYI